MTAALSASALLNFATRTEQVTFDDIGLPGSVTIRELTSAEVKEIAKKGDQGNHHAIRLATTIGGESLFANDDDLNKLPAAIAVRLAARVLSLSGLIGTPAEKKPEPTA